MLGKLGNSLSNFGSNVKFVTRSAMDHMGISNYESESDWSPERPAKAETKKTKKVDKKLTQLAVKLSSLKKTKTQISKLFTDDKKNLSRKTILSALKELPKDMAQDLIKAMNPDELKFMCFRDTTLAVFDLERKDGAIV